MQERNLTELAVSAHALGIDTAGALAQELFESSFPAGHQIKYCAPVEEVKQIERELAALED
jgi:hypothetical protein